MFFVIPKIILIFLSFLIHVFESWGVWSNQIQKKTIVGIKSVKKITPTKPLKMETKFYWDSNMRAQNMIWKFFYELGFTVTPFLFCFLKLYDKLLHKILPKIVFFNAKYWFEIEHFWIFFIQFLSFWDFFNFVGIGFGLSVWRRVKIKFFMMIILKTKWKLFG